MISRNLLKSSNIRKGTNHELLVRSFSTSSVFRQEDKKPIVNELREEGKRDETAKKEGVWAKAQQKLQGLFSSSKEDLHSPDVVEQSRTSGLIGKNKEMWAAEKEVLRAVRDHDTKASSFAFSDKDEKEYNEELKDYDREGVGRYSKM